MPKNGTKATLRWNAYNGPDNNEVEYSAETTKYDTYHVYVKYGTKFDSSIRTEQLTEAQQSFIDNSIPYAQDIPILKDGDEFVVSEEVKDYELYEIEYTFPKEGKYFFSIWAKRDDHWYGPTYYPGVKTNLGVDQEATSTPVSVAYQHGQGEGLNVGTNKAKPSTDALNVNVYGLTSEDYAGGKYAGTEGSPASKDLGSSLQSLDLVDTPSPSFIYSSSFHDVKGMQEIRFDANSRVTIRKQSVGKNKNTPHTDIYFEITGQNLLEIPISFSKDLNSIEVAQAVDKRVELGENYYMNHDLGFAATSHFTEDIVPLRNFDLVVEAYTLDKHTSAGNVVHDGVINKKEGKFQQQGYDIVEVNLLPPSGLMICEEYNVRDGYVTPKKGYEKKIPYIAEAKITDKGAISMTIFESIDPTASSNEKYLSKEEIFQKYFKGIKGCVVYYADEAFALNPADISVSQNESTPTVQKVKVNGITIEVNRKFVLSSDFSVNNDTIIFPFGPFADQQLTQSHVIVGFFDELMRAKHFDPDNNSKTTTLNGQAADTILGEKNLQFSKTIHPLNKIQNKFNPAKHLSEQPTSMTLFKKSPVDEGAKALSYRAYCYILVADGGKFEDKESSVISEKGISDFSQTLSPDSKTATLTIQLKEEKKYIPVINYYEKSGDAYVVGSQSNTVKMTTETIKSELEIKISNSKKIVASKIFIGFISAN